MSVEKVKEYLKAFGRDKDVVETTKDTSTVALAAQAIGITDGEIAKTLSFSLKDEAILVVLAGDVKVDNHKYKDTFGVKATMLSHEDALRVTGHAVGGVCPFALPQGLKVYCDVSLKAHEHVYPACGSDHSFIRLTPDELATCAASAGWVDVAKAPVMATEAHHE